MVLLASCAAGKCSAPWLGSQLTKQRRSTRRCRRNLFWFSRKIAREMWKMGSGCLFPHLPFLKLVLILSVILIFIVLVFVIIHLHQHSHRQYMDIGGELQVSPVWKEFCAFSSPVGSVFSNDLGHQLLNRFLFDAFWLTCSAGRAPVSGRGPEIRGSPFWPAPGHGGRWMAPTWVDLKCVGGQVFRH